MVMVLSAVSDICSSLGSTNILSMSSVTDKKNHGLQTGENAFVGIPSTFSILNISPQKINSN
jgi:hypothetical protein